MINLLKRNILKHKKFQFCLLKDLEENFAKEDEDPYKKFLFDSEYTNKKLQETKDFMMPIEQKKNLLKQKLKNKQVSELYLKYQPREFKKINGLFNEVYDLEEKINLDKESNSFYDRFDFQLQLDPEIAKLNSFKNFEIKQQADNYLKQTLKDKLDYIQVGIDFKEKLERQQELLKLQKDEVIIHGFPLNWQAFQCMQFINNKISDVEDQKIRINKLGQVMYIKLKLKDQKQLEQINNYEIENSTLKVYNQNSNDFDYCQRYVVIEDLQDDLDEEYLQLCISQYAKVDNIHLIKNMQLGQIGETSSFVKHLTENSEYYEKYDTVLTDQIIDNQKKEIQLYQQQTMSDKYNEILSNNLDKNREYDLELKILTDQEIEDQKFKIQQHFNKFKVTTIDDCLKEQNQDLNNVQLQPLLKKQCFNNFGVYEQNLNTAIICFSSKQDAQKGIYGLKFIDKISKKISLLNTTKLYEYIPHFKYRVYFEALKKHENLQQSTTKNVDNIQTQLQTKNLRQQIYENWKDQLPEDFQKKLFSLEANQNYDTFEQNNEYLKRNIQIDKLNQKIELKQKLKKFMDQYAEQKLFTNDNNFDDQLGSVQNNQRYNKQRGRDFGANQLRQATQIMKERLKQREQQNFSFFSQILEDFKEISTNDILKELQSISYEEGVKEALIQQFYYFKERLDMLENKNQTYLQKKIRNTQKVKGFLQGPRFMFSQHQSQQKYNKQKLYDEFFQKQLSFINGDYFKLKQFRNDVAQNQRRKEKSQIDKYAELLHIYDINGNRFYTEEDVKEVEHEIYGEDLSKHKNWEKNEKNFKYQTQTPENIAKSHFNKDLEVASQFFEGFTTKLYYYKKQEDMSCQNLVKQLNKNKEGKYFDFFKQQDDEYYIIEKTKLFNDHLPHIFECLQQYYQKILLQVSIDNGMSAQHLSSCIYKQIKNDQESIAIKCLIEQNSLSNQVEQLKSNGFDDEQIQSYYSLSESELHRQLQYYYQLQDQEKEFQKQNQDIQKLKAQDEQAQKERDNVQQTLHNWKETETFKLQQIKYDLVRQRRLFAKKMQAFLQNKERELLNEGIEKNEKGEVIDDDEMLQEELKHKKQLFNQEIQDLFLKHDDTEVESIESDKFFDDYGYEGDNIDERPSETMDHAIKVDKDEEDEDENDAKLAYYQKKVNEYKQISKKLGSDDFLDDVDQDVLKEQAKFEKEIDEFKNN